MVTKVKSNMITHKKSDNSITGLSELLNTLILDKVTFPSTEDFTDGITTLGTLSDADVLALQTAGTPIETVGFYPGSTTGSAKYKLLNEADSTAQGYVTGYSRFQIRALDVYACLDVPNGEFVYLEQLGAIGDDSTDNTSSLNVASKYRKVSAGEGTFQFMGYVTFANSLLFEATRNTILKPVNATGNTIRINGDNVILRGMSIYGATPGGIQIGRNNNVDGTIIEDVHFKSFSATTFNQVCWLYTCTNTQIRKCFFDDVGYGVIQQLGFVSDHVWVTDNIVKDSRSDFVEANTATEQTKNWIIDRNIFLNAKQYPTAGTEERFVGLTEVENVTITNNIVFNTAGDSAIHLEDLFGKTIIQGNIFIDCFLGAGVIYNLSSEDDMIVDNNYFIVTDNYPFQTESVIGITTTSNSYTHNVTISNNWFIDDTSMPEGTHDGSSNSATLSDSTADFGDVDFLVGKYLYNETDGSFGLITANTSTTITATLAGGTDNDWDSGDAYKVSGVIHPIEVARSGNFDIHHNKMWNTYDMVRFNNINGMTISHNKSYGLLVRGIWVNSGSSNSAGDGVEYSFNRIPNLMDKIYGIRATTNSNGTSGPKRHKAVFNTIDGDIRLRNISGAGGQTEENITFGNSVTGTIVCSDRVTPDANGDYTITSVV